MEIVACWHTICCLYHKASGEQETSEFRLLLPCALFSECSLPLITIPSDQEAVMKNQIAVLAISFISFFLAVSSPGYSGSLSSRCRASTFSDDAFTQNGSEFSVSQKVYLKVTCRQLPVGTYIINTQWVDSHGQLQTERAHRFTIDSPKPGTSYSAYFGLTHFPKGMLRQMVSGGEYGDEQYGNWSILTYLNGDTIDTVYFTVTD